MDEEMKIKNFEENIKFILATLSKRWNEIEDIFKQAKRVCSVVVLSLQVQEVATRQGFNDTEADSDYNELIAETGRLYHKLKEIHLFITDLFARAYGDFNVNELPPEPKTLWSKIIELSTFLNTIKDTNSVLQTRQIDSKLHGRLMGEWKQALLLFDYLSNIDLYLDAFNVKNYCYLSALK